MSDIKIQSISDKKLKKEYQISIPAHLLISRVNQAIEKIRKNYKMPGFRSGKVPVELIKKNHLSSLRFQEIEKIIEETSKKIVKENSFKLALAPKVDFKSPPVEEQDLEYQLIFELFPDLPQISLQDIRLTWLAAEVEQEEIDKAMQTLSARHKGWKEEESDYSAKIGDAVNINYLGKIDGQEFAGGKADNYQLELGSKNFIDNFEEQLVSKKAGEITTVKVKFPEHYHNKEVAGKEAEFEVKINKVLTALPITLNDEFVKKNFFLENLAELQNNISHHLSDNYASMSRTFFKEELLNFLNEKFYFDLPEGLVEEQFNHLWKEAEQNVSAEEQEKAKHQKRELAEKMVRSGIILSEITHQNNINISSEELTKELERRLANFPGQEKEVMEYYEKNPKAIQNLRANLLEEKTVDFILKNAAIETKKVSVLELQQEFSKLREQ